MTIINCKWCGKQISDKAPFCPHCVREGYKTLNTPAPEAKSVVVVVPDAPADEAKPVKDLLSRKASWLKGSPLRIALAALFCLCAGAALYVVFRGGPGLTGKGGPSPDAGRAAMPAFDFAFSSTQPRPEVTLFDFKSRSTPPIDVSEDQMQVTDVNQVDTILRHMGLPAIEGPGRYHAPEKNLFIWDDYELGELGVICQSCGYYLPGGKRAQYNCVSRIYVTLGARQKMIRKARGNGRMLFISREQYGDQWPFAVECGVLHCPQPFSVVMITENEEIFALNGDAVDEKKYADVGKILREGEGLPSDSPILRQGLKLCR